MGGCVGPPSRLLLHQLDMDLRLLSLLRWRLCCLSSGLCSSLPPSSPLPSPRPWRPWRYSCRRVFGRFSGLPCYPSSLPSSLLLHSSLPALLPCLLRLPSLLARNLLASSLGGRKVISLAIVSAYACSHLVKDTVEDLTPRNICHPGASLAAIVAGESWNGGGVRGKLRGEG